MSEVTRQLIERDQRGRAKYGTSLDRTDLSLPDWLQHMAEELLDAAGYALSAKRNALRQSGDPITRCTCPSGDGSLRWPCPSHPPTPPATSGLVEALRKIASLNGNDFMDGGVQAMKSIASEALSAHDAGGDK